MQTSSYSVKYPRDLIIHCKSLRKQEIKNPGMDCINCKVVKPCNRNQGHSQMFIFIDIKTSKQIYHDAMTNRHHIQTCGSMSLTVLLSKQVYKSVLTVYSLPLTHQKMLLKSLACPETEALKLQVCVLGSQGCY